MHPVRRRRFFTVLMSGMVLVIVSSLVLYALRQNINLFYTPSDVFDGSAPLAKRIRLGGMVTPGSVVRNAHSLEVEFTLTDYKQSIKVHYNGILPDLFREGQGIVTTGQLIEPGFFIASEVLAKHDENYMPPEVKQSLAKNLKAN